MPNLREYRSQVPTNGVIDVEKASVDAFGTAGRAMQSFGQDLQEAGQEIYKREEQEEISNLQAETSQKETKWTVEYRKRLQDGTLDVDTFTEEVNKDFDSRNEEINTRGGRLYYEKASSAYKGRLLELAAVGQAQLKGEKAVQNFAATQQNKSVTVFNDPSSYELSKKTQMETIDTLVKLHGLPAEKGVELKTKAQHELAVAAINGTITIGPEMAKKQLQAGFWDKEIDGDTKRQMLGRAEQAIEAKEIDALRAKKLEREALQEKQRQVQDDFIAKLVEGKLSSKEVVNSILEPTEGSGSKKAFLEMIKGSVTRAKREGEGATFNELFRRINLPDGHKDKITDENELNEYVVAGKLSSSKLQVLRNEMNGTRSEEGKIENQMKKAFLANAKGLMTRSNPMLGIRDVKGDEQYAQFLNDFLRTYSEERKKGKTAKELLDRDSKDYLGYKIKAYKRSNEQILDDLNESIAPPSEPSPTPAAPRMEGESISDYMSRTKGEKK